MPLIASPEIYESLKLLDDALSRIIEAAAHIARDRVTVPVETALKKKLARAFKKQGKLFLKRLNKISDKWPVKEAAGNLSDFPDWEDVFNSAADDTQDDFVKAVNLAIKKVMTVSGKSLAAELGLGISFDLKNPRAVKYMQERGLEMLKEINEATTEDLRDLLSASIQNGDSWQDIARGIDEMFGDDYPRWRAKMIARTETGNAYEQGTTAYAAQITKAGVSIEKSWLTDGQADDECADNEDAGWISEDETFPSGDDEPLAHPNCRCTLIRRVVTDTKKED